MASPYRGGKPYEPPQGSIWPSVDTGYDVVASRLSPTRRQAALKRANVVLHDGLTYVKFFGHAINLDLALAGTTGQSKTVRDFYPHNVQIPPLTVQGQCLDQHDYGTVVEFIHQAQNKAIQKSGLTQIEISNVRWPAVAPIVKGEHKPILAQGYISSMPRKYERFVYAPVFEFQIIIVELMNGIYQNVVSAEDGSEKTWMEIMKSLIQPEPKINKKEAEGTKKGVEKFGKSIEEFFEHGF